MVLPKLAENFFDFVYIDAMKKEYLQYLLLAIPKMTSDAMIVIDDVEKFRDKMIDLFDYLDTNRVTYRFEKTDIDDSIMIITANSLSHIFL